MIASDWYADQCMRLTSMLFVSFIHFFFCENQRVIRGFFFFCCGEMLAT